MSNKGGYFVGGSAKLNRSFAEGRPKDGQSAPEFLGLMPPLDSGT